MFKIIIINIHLFKSSDIVKFKKNPIIWKLQFQNLTYVNSPVFGNIYFIRFFLTFWFYTNMLWAIIYPPDEKAFTCDCAER